MGSHTMFVQVVTFRRAAVASLVLLACALLPAPSVAQVELVGSWAARNNEDISRDSYPVDYVGLPLNDEGRTRALAYNESQLAMIERQCEGWPQFYVLQGPFGLRIWADNDPIKGQAISYTIGAWEDRAPMTIWMDGRPEPSKYAEHTRSGYSIGRWEGNTLVARTTHMKAGFLRRNGPPSSDQAVMTLGFYRHGDILTVLAVVEDPIYLAEPHIISKSFQLSAAPISPIGPPCVSTFEGRPPGESVPHFVPERNPFVDELTKMFGLPRDVVVGRPETLYPEHRKTIRDKYVAPPPCTRNCGAAPAR